MNSYTIKVDGLFYAGESDDVEPAGPSSFGGGWSGHGPANVSGIKFGQEPKICHGRRSLLSALERITNRLEKLNPSTITIQKHENQT